jgi:asparagine synthase (glutamine-hydrolysing)
MRLFICVMACEGEIVPEAVRREYERFPRARRIPFQWHLDGPVAALVDSGSPQDASVAKTPDGIAVGIVRLDNRVDLARWAAVTSDDATDLALVAGAVLQGGAKHVPHIVGDFAFVVWDIGTRTAIAARDAVGVRRLYWARRNGFVVFASRAEALACDGAYEVQYLAERVASCSPTPTLTPYRGVSAVPAGTMVTVQDGQSVSRQYWSPYEVSSGSLWTPSDGDAVETCRVLLTEAVRLRLGGSPCTWAHLSGGMDSSSVVGVAQSLAKHGDPSLGLAGAFTYVDPHGSGGDERRYAEAVARRWGVRHEVMVTTSRLGGDEFTVPMTDEPSGSLETVTRDQQVCELMSRVGSTALLSGAGGDVLFAGTMFFFADWVARGHPWEAVREMARRATIGRVSFWELAYRNAVLPLLPGWLRRLVMHEFGKVPGWVRRETARRYGLYDRAAAPRLYAGRIGRKYRDAAAAMVAMVPLGFTVGAVEETVDGRHPFYYRPLVEFALRLPPDLCVRPHARKWVLREAMAGVLPDLVRTRIGKGTYTGAVAWSVTTQRAFLELLVRDSILADLGIITPHKLLAALEAAQFERDDRSSVAADVLATLSIEAWLKARSGQWPRERKDDSLVAPNFAPSI